MKIAWILYGSLEQRTGGTIYDKLIIRGLRDRGDAVVIIMVSAWVPVAPLPTSANDKASSALVRYLARTRPDVVVGDELCFRELAFVFPRCTFTRRVLLVHHLTCWEEEIASSVRKDARRSEAIALRHADHVIATSNTTRTRLLHEGHRGTAIDVVLPGADRLGRSVEPRARHDPRRVLFVGSIIPRKRVHVLVDAFVSVKDAELRIAGSRDRDHAYVREIDQRIESLALTKRVTFLGEIDDAMLARELASADVMVMPSSLEGYGIAATEALYAGTPVIAARSSGLVEALAEYTDAVTFVTDLSTLTDTINDVLQKKPVVSCAMPTWSAAGAAFRALLTRK